MSEGKTDSVRPDEEVLLDLNFVPQWAKKSPGVNHYAAERRPERRPRRENRGDGGRERPVRSRREGRPRPAEDRPAVRAPRAEKIELPVEIRFLPDQKMLSSMVRQIHHSKRAYPLLDLAALFLADMKGHLVKIEVRPEAAGFTLYQGRKSKITATSRDMLLQQLADDHLEDFFTKETIETDPPSGSFPVICKVNDLLIGPPNHHSYADRLLEVHRTRYASMPFSRFKESVQTVRDEALTEQWKKEASSRTVYRLKEAEDPGEFSLPQAEEYVRTHLAETEIEAVTRAVLPGSLARAIRDENLLRMVREAFQRESRFPQSLMFALRAAFRHLHLHSFKAGRNINFVTAVKPDTMHPGSAVDEIRAVLEYLADHPGSTREQLVKGLCPGESPDSEAARAYLNPIRWLVEKGHLIEFFNGTLSVPSYRRNKK